jgi:SAM-dependent methyltransferase
MNHKTLICGLSTYIPGFYDAIVKMRNSSSGGAAKSPRYCYSVWLRHLIVARNNNLIQTVPETVAELGPGDSLGVGLAALLSGSNKYYALDVVQHANPDLNISVLEDLVTLFQKREPVPDDNEWPDLYPKLDTYAFPDYLLTDENIEKALKPERIAAIKKVLKNPETTVPDIEICYFVPWNNAGIIRKDSVDLVISQAVMEHVENLDEAYSAIYFWLRPGGVMSMEIDFANHVMANKWSEHWIYSDFAWNYLVWGKRSYSLNRQPHSTHLSLMKKNNFKIRSDIPHYNYNGINKSELNKKFDWLSEDDLSIMSSLIQGIK